jgi:hypothetical protein
MNILSTRKLYKRKGESQNRLIRSLECAQVVTRLQVFIEPFILTINPTDRPC